MIVVCEWVGSVDVCEFLLFVDVMLLMSCCVTDVWCCWCE